ncbi:MAG: ThiF family adenylyltransferase [Thermoplasmatota archaeon]
MPDRHARQSALPEVGPAGQRRLHHAKVLVVGLGGLGSPAALYLAGAGVGTIGLCDFDRVDATNLHRQPLYALADVGRAKVDAAAARLAALDPAIRLVPLPGRVDGEGAANVVAGWDLVLDCTDDVEARYALSDACAAARIPLVHGAVSQWEGECTVFLPPGPCYRCLFPAPPEGPAATCATDGVLGTVPGIIGTMQAQEALKLVLGAATPLVGRMTLVDGRDGTARTIALKRRAGCSCSVDARTSGGAAAKPLAQATSAAAAHALPQTDGAACPTPWATPRSDVISFAEYEADKGAFFLLDVREPWEAEEASMPGTTLIPLGELQRRAAEVPKGKTVACLCAVGARSAHAANFLRSLGYDAVNLRGGIQAWLALRP